MGQAQHPKWQQSGISPCRCCTAYTLCSQYNGHSAPPALDHRTGRLVVFFRPPDPTRVTNLQDHGMGSLRWAIANAPSGSTITFDTSLHGTILLTSSDLSITRNLTIRGPGAGILSISSGKSGHIVHVVQEVTVTISGLTFKDSETFRGIIDNEGMLMLANSTVSGNKATGSGGGILNALSGMLTLSNSTVSGNTATGDNGGGIDNEGTLTLINSIVLGNTSTGYGGGIYNLGTLTLSNSTVSSNTATGDGGGILNTSTLTLSNSTISDNTATHGNGGGITISGIIGFPVQAMLLYCTVYGNTAIVGGGIWIGHLNEQDQVTMGASIIAGNNAHTGPDIAGPLTTLGYNLVGGRSGATFLGPSKQQSTDVLGVSSTDLGIDPMLRDNGGSARPHTWTHALLLGSPAIDLIPSDVCMMFKVFNDQRGVRRLQGKGCDSGAYEYSP